MNIYRVELFVGEKFPSGAIIVDKYSVTVFLLGENFEESLRNLKSCYPRKDNFGRNSDIQEIIKVEFFASLVEPNKG